MRWFWFATFTLICSLLSVFFRQPLILIGEIFIVDLFITRKVKWLFWYPKSFQRVPGWLNLILWLAITIWIIRVLAIDSLTIETTANKPALQSGDNILVSKVHFGPRLPFSLYRLSGFTNIKRGDLLAFNFPEGDSIVADAGPVSYYALKRRSQSDHDTLFNPVVTYQKIKNRDPEVSRCVGLPGDTISIHSGDEGKRYNYAIPQYDYLVELNGQTLPDYFIKMLNLTGSEVQYISGLGCLLPLRPDQVVLVRQRPEV
ncbi:MAG: S26 family signal peptidase, partial [Bacteroidales bacterium]|nr:S26 family signal peptidase [Bacteroidales bacterium]